MSSIPGHSPVFHNHVGSKMATGNGSTEKNLRVLLVGDIGVGKTTIFIRFKTGHFVDDEYTSSRRDLEYMKHISSEGKEATVTLIDFDRGHRHFYTDYFYEDKHPNFWRYDAYLFVYSITDSESMDNLCSWQDSVVVHVLGHTEGPLCLLVGNKCDLEDDRDVSTQRAQNMADNMDIESDNFFEISAKTGEGFDEVFNCLVQKLGSMEKGKSVSLTRSRFKINDRVSVRDKHGIAHHGTVSSTGVKKCIGQKEMCVEIQMDTYVSSSDIPGAKTGFADFFKSKSNTTVVVPESLVSSSSTRSPRAVSRFVPASPKKTHTATPTISIGTSSKTSQQEEETTEGFQIIDRIDYSADSEKVHESTSATPTLLTQSLPLHRTGEMDQDSQDVSWKASRSLNIGHSPSSDLTVESRVQMSTGDPDNPLVFGVIRWIGEVKNGGCTAGVEMDKYLEGYSDGTLDSTGEKFFSCSPGHGFYCPVAELQPDTGSREYYLKQLQQLETALKEVKIDTTSPQFSHPLSNETQLQEIKAQNASLHQQLHQEKFLLSDLQKLLSETSAEKQRQQATAKAESDTLHHQLQEARLQLSNLQKQLSECSLQQERQQTRAETLSVENAKLEQQLCEEKILSASLQRQLSEISTETLERKLRDEQVLSADLQKRLSELSAENQSLLNAQQESVAFDIEPWKVSRTDIQVERMIGGGGWGAVHKGKLQVAVKQFYPNILSERNLVRLRREMRMLALVRHPNILQFIAAVFDDSGNHKDYPPYIITELLDTSLRALYEEGPISEENQVSIFLDTARALNYLHQRYEPIIHRDVSSANVLLKCKPNNTWLAKLSDLGSANLAQEAYTMNEGARVYCAPEAFTFDINAQSDVTLTPKVDVYSYGVMLCEVATCTFPEAKKMPSTLEKVSANWSPLYWMIVSCIKDNPEDRPTMTRIIDMLRELPQCK